MNQEPKRSAFTHTVSAENGMVTVCRNDVAIYSFKADLVEEMAIEPRKLAGHGTPCAVLILRGAGPGGILFETHELAAQAMRTIEGAKSDTRHSWRWIPYDDCCELVCKCPNGDNLVISIISRRGDRWEGFRYPVSVTIPSPIVRTGSARLSEVAEQIVSSLRELFVIRPGELVDSTELEAA